MENAGSFPGRLLSVKDGTSHALGESLAGSIFVQSLSENNDVGSSEVTKINKLTVGVAHGPRLTILLPETDMDGGRNNGRHRNGTWLGFGLREQRCMHRLANVLRDKPAFAFGKAHEPMGVRGKPYMRQTVIPNMSGEYLEGQ